MATLEIEILCPYCQSDAVVKNEVNLRMGRAAGRTGRRRRR